MNLPAVHNEDATTANLARSVLQGVDRSCERVSVQTETLVLLLGRLIDLLEPRRQEAAQQQERTVRQLVAEVETAARNRDEDEAQARGDSPPRQRRPAWG